MSNSLKPRVVLSRPPLPTGNKPWLLHWTSSCSDSSWSSGVPFCRQIRMSFKSSELQCAHALSTLKSTKPCWWEATPIARSRSSSACICSVDIGKYLRRCHNQHCVWPWWRCWINLGLVWYFLWQALQTSSAAKLLIATRIPCLRCWWVANAAWLANCRPHESHSWAVMEVELSSGEVQFMSRSRSFCCCWCCCNVHNFFTRNRCARSTLFKSLWSSRCAGWKSCHVQRSRREASSSGTSSTPSWSCNHWTLLMAP